jgi:hypothetical protein
MSISNLLGHDGRALQTQVYRAKRHDGPAVAVGSRPVGLGYYARLLVNSLEGLDVLPRSSLLHLLLPGLFEEVADVL